MEFRSHVQQPVDPAEVMGRRFDNDLWVFDMANEGRIVACRAPMCRDRVGENFFSLLSEQSAEQVRTYLFSYERAPMAVETEVGIALIVSFWMPEAALGVAVLPAIPANGLIRLLSEQTLTPIHWAEGLRERGAVRLSANMRAQWGLVEAMLGELLALGDFSLAPDDPSEYRRMERFGMEQVRGLSLWIGCPVEVACLEYQSTGCPIRAGLFSAFLLLSLCLCRYYAAERRAIVSMDCISHQPAISVTMTVLSEGAYHSEALACLRGIAERNNVFFDVSFHDARLYLRISPIGANWALLGLKEPNVFDDMGLD